MDKYIIERVFSIGENQLPLEAIVNGALKIFTQNKMFFTFYSSLTNTLSGWNNF